MEKPDQPQNPLQVVPRVLQDIEKNLELLVQIGYYNQTQKLFLSHYLQKFDHALKVTERWSKPSSEESKHNVAVNSIADAASIKIECSQSAQKTSINNLKEERALDEEPSFSWAQVRPFCSDPDGTAKTSQNLGPKDEGTLKPSIRHDANRDLILTGLQAPFSKGDICRLLENYGEVESCQIIPIPKTGRSSGVGVIRMANADQASAVIEGLQDMVIGGCTITIIKAPQSQIRAAAAIFGRGSNSSLRTHTSSDYTSQISASKDDVPHYDYEEYVSKSGEFDLTHSEDFRNDYINLHGHGHGHEITQPANTSVQPAWLTKLNHQVEDRMNIEPVISNRPKSKAVAKEVKGEDERNVRKLREHKAEMDRIENKTTHEILEEEQKRRTVGAQALLKDSLEMKFVPATESNTEHNDKVQDRDNKQSHIIAPFQPTNKWGKPIPRDPTRNYPGDIVGASALPFGKGNKGRDLVEKMGWKDGEGLGPNGEGRPDLISRKVNFSRHGLGVEAPSDSGPGSVNAELPVSDPATVDFGSKQAWDMAPTEEEYRQRRAEEAALRRAAKDSSTVRTRKTKGVIANLLQEGDGSDESGKTIKFTACMNRDFISSRHFPGAIIKVLDSNTGDARGISGLYGEEQLEVVDNDVLELTGQHHKYVLAYNERTQKSGLVRIAWVNIGLPVHSNQTQVEPPQGETGLEKDIDSLNQLELSTADNATGGWTTSTNPDHTLTEDDHKIGWVTAIKEQNFVVRTADSVTADRETSRRTSTVFQSEEYLKDEAQENERARSLRRKRSSMFANTSSISVSQTADKSNMDDKKGLVSEEDDDEDDIYGYEVGWNAACSHVSSQPTYNQAVDWNASSRATGTRPRTYHTSTGKVITENSNMPVARGTGPQSRVPPPNSYATNRTISRS